MFICYASTRHTWSNFRKLKEFLFHYVYIIKWHISYRVLNFLFHLKGTDNGNTIPALARSPRMIAFKILTPRQDGGHFPDDVFQCIFLNENAWISIKISLKFIPKGPINNIPALIQIMAWRRPGDKPLSEPMMVKLPTHICVTRPQWVKTHYLCGMRVLIVDINVNLFRHKFKLISFHSFLPTPKLGLAEI